MLATGTFLDGGPMRAIFLGLFFYGITAFCQSSAPAPVTAENPAETPLVLAPPPSRDFSNFHQGGTPHRSQTQSS